MVRKLFLSLVIILVLSSAAFAGENVQLLDANGNALKPSQIDKVSIRKTCGDCHDVDASAKALHFNKGQDKPDPETSSCLDCHLSKSNAFNADGTIKKVVPKPTVENCNSCHPDVSDAIASSVHGRADKVAGDHPNCASCHGGNPHSMKPVSKMTQQDKAAMCSNCHSQKDKMHRYGVSADAVSSYEQSFHGKALLRFGKSNSATCTNCHGSHDVLAPSNPAAPTNRKNAAKTCAQCHKGAKMNFAMSGANHLKLKLDKAPVLKYEELFFKVLTLGTMLFLIGLITLDLRKKVFCADCHPKSGKFIGTVIATSFISLIAGLAMAVIGIKGAGWAWIISIVLMAVAFLAYGLKRKPKEQKEKLYQRFNMVQRIQHGLLALSFTVLVLSGMPLKFAHVEWAHYLQLLFGGFDGARLAHRIGADVMIFTWIWHTLYLMYQWKKAGFSLRSWTMFPTLKDVSDFFGTLKYGLGLQKAPPPAGRFQFKEKFDYFAVYWGMPIMVLSGLVLWFPIFFGNKFSELTLGISYIAHSDEALLAMLAILIWHFYNTHFNPDHFPMNSVFYSGVMTESEMEREHPLEKAKIDGK